MAPENTRQTPEKIFSIKSATVILLVVVAVFLRCAPVSSALAASAAQDAQTALRAAEKSLKLQTDLPVRLQKRPPPPTATLDMTQALLWGSLLVAALAIGWALYGNSWSASRARRLMHLEEEAAAPAAVAMRMEKAHVEADVLALQGSFAEAMHVLLLQSVSELRRRLDVSIAASLTSREILLRAPLAPEARAGFADIISRVEISYFGAHQPSEEEYLACCRSFELLTHALREGGIR